MAAPSSHPIRRRQGKWPVKLEISYYKLNANVLQSVSDNPSKYRIFEICMFRACR
jgi:hypothetical protein